MINYDESATVMFTVGENDTAAVLHSGALPVFATPNLVCLMECAACNCLHLPDGQTTVGAMVQVEHMAPSPIGAQIKAVSRVTRVDGRRIEYEFTAYDNAVPPGTEGGTGGTGATDATSDTDATGDTGWREIGKGIHTRVIIDADRFMNKVNVLELQ